MLRKWTWSSFLGIGLGVTCVVAAQAQQNTSHPFGPDQCGPGDPSYIRTANETGGVPLFLQRSEAVKAMQLVREYTRENVSTLLWASARLSGAVHSFDIPVDSRIERITFTFSVDTKGNKLALREPNGQLISALSSRTEDTELNCGRIVTIEKPQPGKWRAEVSGSGTYWLQAQVQSDIYFIKAQFVELRGRPAHEGLFRIPGQPVAGKPATLEISLSADEAASTEFAFVSERGDLLEKLSLKNTDPDREFLEFSGEVKLPSVPFRVAVNGYDTKGMPFQRFHGPLFHAETVEVVPKLDFDAIAAGETKHGVFEVRNLGPAGKFNITVTDARKYLTRVEPRELMLEKGASGLVQVELAAPAGQVRVGEDDLVVVATSLNSGSSNSGRTSSNSSVVRLSIVGADHAP